MIFGLALPPGAPRRLAARVQRVRARLPACLAALDGPASTWQAELTRLRRDLARELSGERTPDRWFDGLGRLGGAGRGAAVESALAWVAALMPRTLGRAPYDGQLQAALAMLDGRLAEMATGEGKSLALAAAAAVAALAGFPVHVFTANDYLAQRDLEASAPLFAALGLSAACVQATDPAPQRQAAWRCRIVYATAAEAAFDHLRDQLNERQIHPPVARPPTSSALRLLRQVAALAGRPWPEPLLPGRHLALIDEADYILLDQAVVPLVLSRRAPNAARRAFLWQALAVARSLEPAHHEGGGTTARRLTPAGREAVAERAAGLSGPWRRARYREEAVLLALTALHDCRRDRDYLVRGGRVELLDALSGRHAVGRRWSRGLQTAVEIKEGCAVSDDSETLAQTSFQRFFRGYRRLGGVSATLRESAGELFEVYGLRVVVVPRRLPCRLQRGPLRRFASDAARWAAVVSRATELQRAGRPVLIGTDSVEDARALSQSLQAAGLVHQVLDARHDAEEAAIVARAGLAGCLTVATRMAGRGTDIALCAQARAAGGLHVLACQHNRSARHDRQLWGRAARHGEPGSVEQWLVQPDGPVWPGAHRLAQFWSEQRDRALRRLLLEKDTGWADPPRPAPATGGEKSADPAQVGLYPRR